MGDKKMKRSHKDGRPDCDLLLLMGFTTVAWWSYNVALVLS